LFHNARLYSFEIRESDAGILFIITTHENKTLGKRRKIFPKNFVCHKTAALSFIAVGLHISRI